MKYFYHYYGFAQISAGSVKHIDGTLLSPYSLDSRERFVEFKERVAKDADVDATTLTIVSLTLLHETTKYD